MAVDRVHEASFYQQLDNNLVLCGLCRQRCRIPSGKRGICGVRENQHGVLYSLVYGKLIAQHVDPIEKKPLYHVLPGSSAYSIATAGCNFRCQHCQNAEISQTVNEHPGHDIPGPRHEISPESVVQKAIQAGCQSIAYTYTEPTIFYEYAFDVARLAHDRGLKNLFVTNGYICDAPLTEIAPFLDAANIDLKGYNTDFYQRVCGARLDETLAAIRSYHRLGIWIEITTLVIPGLNDTPDELSGIAQFIHDLNPDIPWHISRFHPDYKMSDRNITPTQTLLHAQKIGHDVGLNYIYVGNVRDLGETTHCPQCAAVILQRKGFAIIDNQLTTGHCSRCHSPIAGLWD